MCCETSPRDFQIVQTQVRCQGCANSDASSVLLYGEREIPYCKPCYLKNPYCEFCQAPTHAFADTAVGLVCGRCCRMVKECLHCGVAGLETYYHFDQVPDVRVCGDCRGLGFGHCLQCGEFSALGEGSFCKPCSHTAVTCEHQARELAGEVFRFLENEFGLSYEEAFDFHLVDKIQEDSRGSVRGLWQVTEAGASMWVVKGLPLSQFQATIAHEYAHAWHFTQFTSPSQELAEGFASWVQRKVLLELYWDHSARALEESELEFYGSGLRKCLAWERHLGEEGLLEKMEEWDHFPELPSCLAVGRRMAA